MATAVNKSSKPELSTSQEHQIAAVLENRFGSGCLYVPRNISGRLLLKANDLGFIDDNGLLTRKGRTLIARYL